MINFRYHVVSLTAVFLALAIGLVVGTAALNGPVADALEDQVNALRKDNSKLRDAGQPPQGGGRTARRSSPPRRCPMLLAGKLTGRRVLLRDHCRRGQATTSTASPRCSSRRRREDHRPGRRSRTSSSTRRTSDELLDLADQAAAPTVASTGLPANSNGVETSSALLAARAAGPDAGA